MATCPCGSGTEPAQCCYRKYPSIVCQHDLPPDPVDFYARWSISRHMIWRSLLPHLATPALRRGAPRRVAVLGAGSCRDLPMDFLCDVFDEVVLVDKDGEALANHTLYAPSAAASGKVVKVTWDINGTGAFGAAAEALASVRTSGLTLTGAADLLHRAIAPWHAAGLPPDLQQRLPFTLVLSDLVMTQLAMYYAYALALALGRPLRELNNEHRNQLLRIASAMGHNHLELLRLLIANNAGATIAILNDTFMLGRDFDGSESLFNQVAAARGRDARSAAWITPADLTAWLPEYPLLGSNLPQLLATDALQDPNRPLLALLDKTWWWWPHCVNKSYLVVCYLLEALHHGRRLSQERSLQRTSAATP